VADFKWLFEFGARLDPVAKAEAQLKRLEEQLAGSSEATEKADAQIGRLNKRLHQLRAPAELAKLERELKKLEHPPGVFHRAVHHAFSGAGAKIGEFARGTLQHFTALGAAEGLKMMTEKVIEFGKEMLAAAGNAERSASSFKLMLGVEGGESLLRWIEDIAKYTEFSDDQVKGFAQTLLKAGYSGAGLKKALLATLDLAAIDTNKDAGAGAALGALEMLQSTHQVNTRMFKSFGMEEDDFYKQLSKNTGTGIETLKKQMTAGKVDLEQSKAALFQLITRKTKGDLGTAAFGKSEGMNARIMHLKDLPDQFMQGLVGTPALQKLSDSIAHILEVFDPESPKGKKIAAGLERMVTMFADMLGKVDVEHVADVLLKTFTALPPLVESLAAALGLVVDGLMGVAKWMGAGQAAAAKAGGAGPSMQGPTTAGLGGGMLTTDSLKAPGWVQKIEGWFGIKPETEAESTARTARETALFRATPAGQAAMKEWMAAGLMNAQGGAKGMDAGAPLLKAAGGRAAMASSDGFTTKAEIKSPSRLFERHGRMTGEGFALGLEATHARIARAATRSIDVISPAAGATTDTRTLGGGPISVSVPITVNVEGGGNVDADDIASRLRDLVPGQLQAALEQLRVELGIA
jgi:hypothetical protein